MSNITNKNQADKMNVVNERERGQPNLNSCKITLVNTKIDIKNDVKLWDIILRGN